MRKIQLQNISEGGWNKYIGDLPQGKQVWVYEWGLGWRVSIYSKDFYLVADVHDIRDEEEAVEIANVIIAYSYPQLDLQVLL